ncbi:TPA: hypothetical protein ACXDFX_004749 [Enterobacter roggenkampii]
MENNIIDLYFKLPGQYITDNDLETIFKSKIVVIKDGIGTGKTTILNNIYNKLTLPSKSVFIDDLSFQCNKKLLREKIQKYIADGVFIFITTSCKYSVINYYLKPFLDYCIYESVYHFYAFNQKNQKLYLGLSTHKQTETKEDCLKKIINGEIYLDKLDTDITDMSIVNEIVAERDKIKLEEILKSKQVSNKRRL